MTDDAYGGLPPRARFLIDQTERALRDGAEMLAWWRSTGCGASLAKFDLLLKGGDVASMHGFYEQIRIGGKPTSVMGCLQTLRFGRSGAAGECPAGLSLRSFARGEFFRVCQWRHPDGLPGGFGYQALLYQEKGSGRYGTFADAGVDLSQLGSRLEWALLQVEIFDFVRSFPPLRRFARTLSRLIREAAYIVVHPEYLDGNFSPAPGAIAECGLGYSFVPCTVHPNFFGFGPGRFGTALKLLRFALLESGQMQIDLAFLVAPRSQKVLYLGGFDPVYSLVHLIDTVTLGKFGIRRRLHDKLDFIMLRQHGDVHQNFIEAMRAVWEGSWAEADQPPESAREAPGDKTGELGSV
ncbi:MAG: hypothetical protein HYX74_03260, partial [Acidobacteria bacterium]|nr:hypothetical protein [Acidobacteriota bacterium]